MSWLPPETECSKVLIKKGQLKDSDRDNRVVPLKAYYPVLEVFSQQKLPVILWSHGLGGSVDGASFLSRYLASHGFVVVHIQHEGTDSSLWEGKPGHPWDIIRNTTIPRSATLNRFLDVPFVLNSLPEWSKDHEAIDALANFDCIGMSGHSFGALTTQVIAGQMFPDEEGALRQYADNRFKAGILYSPVPIQHLASDEPDAIYSSISMPMLHMTGTEDSSPVEGWDYKKRLVVYNHADHPNQYLHILDQGDHMIYNGSRGQLADNPLRESHEKEICQTALAFWESYLKNNEAAYNWLKSKL